MSDLNESDFDSDEESEMQDLEQLNAAISELDSEEPRAGSRAASVPHDTSTTATSIYSASSSYGEYSKVETAIALNKMCAEKLRRLETILRSRLIECRRRLAEVRNVSATNQSEKTQRFNYVNCGKPYFKDKTGFPAPDNEDTLLMKKSEMYNFSSIVSVPGWTVKDKFQLKLIIHKMSRDLKKKKLNLQISQLQHKNKLLYSKKNNKIIAQLRKELANVNKEPLKSLALPIDEEYDWDYIANRLSERHTADEYRSLWKLFLHPSINQNTWSKSEHINLQKIAFERELQDWDAIAKELGTNRSNYQCFVYFRTNMNNTFTSRKWTKEEEEYLMRLIEYYREENYIPWGKVAASMENRTKVQVYNKYARLSELRKGKFLPEEDSVILTCVNIFGKNFRKVSEYLHGRSVTQCRERYHILMKRNYSAVWTVDEDRKLVQVMVNQDSSSNFSDVTQYFPGKDRVHIRSRYLTLCRWMRRNPNIDIKHAPKRGARRLSHGKSVADLNRAIENLKKRLESEVTVKKKTRVTKDSSEDVIDDAIVALITTEHTRLAELQKLQGCQEEQCSSSPIIGGENCNVTVLHKLLILLKAKLNRQKFAASSLRNTYQGLFDAEPGPSTVQVRSYSKKEAVRNLKIENNVNIWGNVLPNPLSYVLPPHYATITGCRQLMAYYMKSKAGCDDTKNMNILIRRNMLVKEQVNILMERFNTLFLWPMLLSNASPEDCKVTNEGNSVPSTSKSARQFVAFERADYNFVMPPPNKIENIDDEDTIDLVESVDCQKIDIDDSYFASIE